MLIIERSWRKTNVNHAITSSLTIENEERKRRHFIRKPISLSTGSKRSSKPKVKQKIRFVTVGMSNTVLTALWYDLGIYPIDYHAMSGTVMHISSDSITQTLSSLLTSAHVKHAVGDIPVTRVHRVMTLVKRTLQKPGTQLFRHSLSLNLHLTRMPRRLRVVARWIHFPGISESSHSRLYDVLFRCQIVILVAVKCSA